MHLRYGRLQMPPTTPCQGHPHASASVCTIDSRLLPLLAVLASSSLQGDGVHGGKLQRIGRAKPRQLQQAPRQRHCSAVSQTKLTMPRPRASVLP